MRIKKLGYLGLVSMLLLCASFLMITYPCAADAKSDKPIVWKAATFSGPKFWSSATILWLANELKARTNGRLTIEVYTGGSSGIKQPASLSAVRDGLVEMMWFWGAAVSSELQAYETQTLPGLIPGDLNIHRAVGELVTPVMADFVKKHNGLLYFYTVAEYRQIYSRVPIRSLAEMKGKKIRTQGALENDYTIRLGASPVSMTASDVYTALQQGVIDGAWISDAGAFFAFKWYEVTDYIIDLKDGGATCTFVINRDAFEALPKDIQKIVMDIQPEFEKKIYDSMFSLAAIARKNLIEKGMKVVSWPEEELKKKQAIAASIWDSWYKSADEGARKIFDMTDSYLKKNAPR